MGRMKNLSIAAQIFPDRFQPTAKKKTAVTPKRVHSSHYKSDNMAKFSTLAYETDDILLSKSARKLGYDIDTELSTANHKVFINRRTGNVVIAYRGTNPKNMDDIAAGVDIAKGQRTHKRFQEALEAAEKARKKYGDDRIELTGHSLGGTQALYVYEKTGLKTRVFNPGSSPLGEKLKRNGDRKVDIVRHEHDAVSLGWANEATETYQSGTEMGKLLFGDWSIRSGIEWQLGAHGVPGEV